VLGSSLNNERFVNVGDNTTTSDSRLNQSVELFITTNSKLQVAWSDTLDLKVFAGVTSKFKNFSSEVLKNGS